MVVLSKVTFSVNCLVYKAKRIFIYKWKAHNSELLGPIVWQYILQVLSHSAVSVQY